MTFNSLVQRFSETGEQYCLNRACAGLSTALADMDAFFESQLTLFHAIEAFQCFLIVAYLDSTAEDPAKLHATVMYI